GVRPRLVVADRRRRDWNDDLGLLLPRHRARDVLPQLVRAPARTGRRLAAARARPPGGRGALPGRDSRLVLRRAAADRRRAVGGARAAALTFRKPCPCGAATRRL